MNERLKRLGVEAGLISAEYNGFDRTELTEAEKKFAEAIINQCVKLCMEVAEHADTVKNSEFTTDAGKMLHEGMWGGAQSCARKIIFGLGEQGEVNG